ncbi:MAG: KEOPS complex N(6)-L-threonylcarbamoyladenine synthase Kae1 [Candidatus Pacearchaeota archaeon]
MILGIESTAHTFGIGIVKNGKIIANSKDSYITESGGIIPKEAADHHERASVIVLNNALKEAKIKLNEIRYIAFSQGPGLSPCLIKGRDFAVKLAKELNIPIIGVNHCIAHLEISRITNAKDPVMIYASGANTQIIAYSGKRYRVFGETLDIGIGNLIDNFARYIGIGFPGGPKIAELAKKSSNYIPLPYSIKGMDIAFSGILTKLKNMIDSKKYRLEDLAYSLQETVFAMLIEAGERAMAHTEKEELVLAGGVACNERLQEMSKLMCKERGSKAFIPDNSLLTDNGAMIAFLGEIMIKKRKKVNNRDIDIFPKQRTDEVEIFWK